MLPRRSQLCSRLSCFCFSQNGARSRPETEVPVFELVVAAYFARPKARVVSE